MGFIFVKTSRKIDKLYGGEQHIDFAVTLVDFNVFISPCCL
jgi:hypothetical protein